jgi:hypothetical protein
MNHPRRTPSRQYPPERELTFEFDRRSQPAAHRIRHKRKLVGIILQLKVKHIICVIAERAGLEHFETLPHTKGLRKKPGDLQREIDLRGMIGDSDAAVMSPILNQRGRRIRTWP